MPLQQKTFVNIVTKGEIAQNEQCRVLAQSFQLFYVSIPSFSEIFNNNIQAVFKVVCCRFPVCGKSLSNMEADEGLRSSFSIRIYFQKLSDTTYPCYRVCWCSGSCDYNTCISTLKNTERRSQFEF